MNSLLICLFLLFIPTSAKEEKLPKNQLIYKLIQPSCSKSHFWVILVDQPQNDSSNQTDNSRHLYNDLLKLRCNFLHLTNITLTELNSQMAPHRYHNLQFIFDYTTSSELNQGQFTQTLERLSLFYFNCYKCQPLIVLWSATLHLKLEKWSQLSLTFHSVRHLQALFVIQETLLQYRPIGAGCLQTNELLIGVTDPTIPSTSPESECNLHSSRLNVSVNDVNGFVAWWGGGLWKRSNQKTQFKG